MTRNLFRTLLSLHQDYVPEEDFFTEVIAWFFSHHPVIMFDWLHLVFGLPRNLPSFHVSTQVPFPKLDSHDFGSRVDMVIELYEEEKTHVIFLESKIGSDEQPSQLSRYADHLCHSFPEGTKGYLLYVTKYYDPKEEGVILAKKDGRNAISFEQRRWHQFYEFLKPYKDDLMVSEIIEFMKEEGMSEIEQLTPALLVAFSAFSGVYKFVKQSLDGDVEERQGKIMGSKPVTGDRYNQIEQRDRYIIYSFDKTNSWYCMLGYHFPLSLDQYPELFMALEINGGNAKNRWGMIAEEFEEIYKYYKNQGQNVTTFNLDKPKSWANVVFRYPMNSLLGSTQNHKSAVRQQFHTFLGLLEQIKHDHLQLWEL